MVGQRIAALRRSRGWSQAQLADLLQISPSTLGMYEQGRREPGGAILVALSENFGVSTDYLLTGKIAPGERSRIAGLLEHRITALQQQLSCRNDPLSSQELAALLTAILTNE